MSGWIKSTVNQNMNQEEPATLAATTQPSPKPVTPPPTSTVNLSNPNKEVMNQMTELSKNNKDFDEVFDDISEEDTQSIINDLQNGEQVETVTDRLVKRRQAKKDAKGSKPKKDIPWDVIATAVSGLGAMFGVSPFINFTQFGFDVTNRRDERRAESEGKQKALAKAGEGEVTSGRKDDVATYTEQREKENMADNAAAIKMATDQLRAEYENAKLTLNSQERIAFEQMKNNKEIKNLELEAEKALSEAGLTHAKEMVDLMSQAQYKAFLTAKEKGFKGDYAAYNRSEAGRSTWEAAFGTAAQIGNVAVQAIGAANGK